MSVGVLNPVDIETKIQEVTDRIAKSVRIISDLEGEAKSKRTDFDAAFAHSYLRAADYPAHERKYRALLETVELRRAAEVAECAFKFAERKAHALDKELFSWQSISKSVIAMYGAVRT